MARNSLILRAAVVLPVCAPPVRDGVVTVSGSTVKSVGRWRDLDSVARKGAVNLGDTVLLPGFVNAHCHLDYTHMVGQLPPPKSFTDWLKAITECKAGWGLGDYQDSWLGGAQMLVRTGTTTVGDIEALPQLLPAAWGQTPLRVVSFLELIGITARRPPRQVLREALDLMPALKHPRCRGGLSPHAPYSTVPELLRIAAQTARSRRYRLCVHVAESALEYQMFCRADGEMYEWLRRSGREMSDCGQGSPVQHLERCGVLGSNLLAAHVNYLRRNDAQLLASRGVHVVHCPRSHFYFSHGPFPLRRLLRAGVNVCLGTDSLASVCKTRRHPVELSMFEEMRALAAREPWLSPRTILRMATENGARALDLAGRVGRIWPGAFADLIAVPVQGSKGGIHEKIVHHHGAVAASLIEGRWAVTPKP